jgi:hypothetical protein
MSSQAVQIAVVNQWFSDSFEPVDCQLHSDALDHFDMTCESSIACDDSDAARFVAKWLEHFDCATMVRVEDCTVVYRS